MSLPQVPQRVESLADLPTPALVFDGAKVEANIQRMAEYGRRHNLGIRPHTKTHKSLKVAAMQLAAGACGLTVAKVGEAEVMSEVGSDILIAYPVFDEARRHRAAALAKQVTLRIAVDSRMAIERLGDAAAKAGSTIGILVDIDVGMGRTGVATVAESLELAQLVDSTRGLRLDGIMCYPGQIWNAPAEQAGPMSKVSAKLAEAIDLWKRNGLQAKIVSGGSTPTAYQSHLVPEFTEIRPGTYVYNDLNEARAGFSSNEECAAKILVTVISTAVAGQVVIDGGSKTFTSDLCVPQRDSGHGSIIGHSAAKIVKLSEEHGQVDVTADAEPPKIGDRLEVVPNHICPCVNLQKHAWWLNTDGSLDRIPIDAQSLLS